MVRTLQIIEVNWSCLCSVLAFHLFRHVYFLEKSDKTDKPDDKRYAYPAMCRKNSFGPAPCSSPRGLRCYISMPSNQAGHIVIQNTVVLTRVFIGRTSIIEILSQVNSTISEVYLLEMKLPTRRGNEYAKGRQGRRCNNSRCMNLK